jgi:hypothetical protein
MSKLIVAHDAPRQQEYGENTIALISGCERYRDVSTAVIDRVCAASPRDYVAASGDVRGGDKPRAPKRATTSNRQ